VRVVGGATCSSVGRDRSGGGSRRCAGGLLGVGLCPGSASADRVSRRIDAGACGEQDDTEVQCDDSDGRRRVTRAFLCWCSSDGAIDKCLISVIFHIKI